MILLYFYGIRKKIKNKLVNKFSFDLHLLFYRFVLMLTFSSFRFDIERMTGHQQLINCVQFSPDGRLIASASFDKSIKLWDGRTGKYVSLICRE